MIPYEQLCEALDRFNGRSSTGATGTEPVQEDQPQAHDDSAADYAAVDEASVLASEHDADEDGADLSEDGLLIGDQQAAEDYPDGRSESAAHTVDGLLSQVTLPEADGAELVTGAAPATPVLDPSTAGVLRVETAPDVTELYTGDVESEFDESKR